MDKGDAASVNAGRPSHLPGCVSTGGRTGRRTSSSLRWCAADQGRPVRERSWASAAAPAPPDPSTTVAPPDPSTTVAPPDPGTTVGPPAPGPAGPHPDQTPPPIPADQSSPVDRVSNVAATAASPAHRAARPTTPR